MDVAILLRLLPAVAVAVGTAAVVDPARRLRPGEAFDEVVRFLLVALVAGRLWWLLLGGPDVWRGILSTIVLVRAGVATGVGALVAGAWVLLRRDVEPIDRAWRLVAIVPAALAGGAVWQALCTVEGVCGGVPVSWGIRFPGRAVAAFPVAWVEAAVLLALLAIGWRTRASASRWWLLGALAAAVRVALGFAKPTIAGVPSADQLGFVAVAIGCLAVRRWLVRPPSEGVVPVVGAGGRELAVRRVGDPARPVVLLAHGVGSSAKFVEEAFAAPLLAAGWGLAALDLGGHGDSASVPDVTGHHLDRYAEDLAAAAAVVRPAVVGGVSIGGMAAVRAVARGLPGLDDVRAVAAVIPGWTGAAQPGEGPHAVIADEVRRVGVPGLLARLEAEPDLPDWIREVVLRDYRRHDPASLAAALVALDGGDAPTLDEVASLAVPIALVGWPDDPGHPLDVAEAWGRSAPSSALATTSIAAMQDDRTAFGRALVATLADLGIRPAGAARAGRYRRPS